MKKVATWGENSSVAAMIITCSFRRWYWRLWLALGWRRFIVFSWARWSAICLSTGKTLITRKTLVARDTLMPREILVAREILIVREGLTACETLIAWDTLIVWDTLTRWCVTGSVCALSGEHLRCDFSLCWQASMGYVRNCPDIDWILARPLRVWSIRNGFWGRIRV